MENNIHLFIQIASAALTPEGEVFPNEQTAEFIDKLIEKFHAENVGEFVTAGGTSKSLEVTFAVNGSDSDLAKANSILKQFVEEDLFSTELVHEETNDPD